MTKKIILVGILLATSFNMVLASASTQKVLKQQNIKALGRLKPKKANRFLGNWVFNETDTGNVITIVVKEVTKTSKNRFGFVYDTLVNGQLSDLNLIGVLTSDRRAVLTTTNLNGHSLIGFKLNKRINGGEFSSIFVGDRDCDVLGTEDDELVVGCVVGLGQVSSIIGGPLFKER